MADTPSPTDECESTLDPTQTARVEALAVSRGSLADSSGGPMSQSHSLPKRFGTQDLIDVAQWIIDGADPLAAYRAERAEERATWTANSEEAAG